MKRMPGSGSFERPPSCSVGVDFLPDPVGILIFGDVEIVAALQVYPELRRCAEIAGQPNCRVCRDRPLAVNDLVDSPRGDGEGLRKTVLTDPHRREEFLEQDLAGVNGGLIIDADTVLAGRQPCLRPGRSTAFEQFDFGE